VDGRGELPVKHIRRGQQLVLRAIGHHDRGGTKALLGQCVSVGKEVRHRRREDRGRWIALLRDLSCDHPHSGPLRNECQRLGVAGADVFAQHRHRRSLVGECGDAVLEARASRHEQQSRLRAELTVPQGHGPDKTGRHLVGPLRCRLRRHEGRVHTPELAVEGDRFRSRYRQVEQGPATAQGAGERRSTDTRVLDQCDSRLESHDHREGTFRRSGLL
jgi:hypothetical protein